MIIVLDVETLDINYNQICDIAWATVERNRITAIKNYIPLEHLARMAEGSFSKSKMSATMAEVANGNAIIKPWAEIAEELKQDFTEATYIYAYNASFDRSKVISINDALQTTAYGEFFKSAEIFDKWRDLWAWSSNTILFKKSFIDFCTAHNLRTPKKYCSTSAETTLKFINNDPDYVEAHTARQDVLDEFQIYLTIKKAIKREYAEICLDDEETNFKGKPFYNIKRLEDAINN